jgi:hypothetical protein
VPGLGWRNAGGPHVVAGLADLEGLAVHPTSNGFDVTGARNMLLYDVGRKVLQQC